MLVYSYFILRYTHVTVFRVMSWAAIEVKGSFVRLRHPAVGADRTPLSLGFMANFVHFSIELLFIEFILAHNPTPNTYFLPFLLLFTIIYLHAAK